MAMSSSWLVPSHGPLLLGSFVICLVSDCGCGLDVDGSIVVYDKECVWVRGQTDRHRVDVDRHVDTSS
jgi:hypothetical protein